jgi:hypothetical protein
MKAELAPGPDKRDLIEVIPSSLHSVFLTCDFLQLDVVVRLFSPRELQESLLTE